MHIDPLTSRIEQTNRISIQTGQPVAFRIAFRAKVKECRYTDGTLASRYVEVPNLTRSHVDDMAIARQSKRFGGYANSDLFPAMMRREAVAAGCKPVGERLRVDLLQPLPDSILVDESGFLAVVNIRIPD